MKAVSIVSLILIILFSQTAFAEKYNRNWSPLNSGAIAPRFQIYPDITVNELNIDIIMDATAGMPMVRFLKSSY